MLVKYIQNANVFGLVKEATEKPENHIYTFAILESEKPET